MKTTRYLFLTLVAAWLCTSCTKADDDAYQPIDYAIQTVTSIDRVIPAKLIAAMGPYLNFGDMPPKIDTCFFAPRFHLDTIIKNDTNTVYNKPPQWFSYRFTWKFVDQHRCAIDSLLFEKKYLENYIYDNGLSDTVFVMGNSNYFTAYYQQNVEYIATIPTNYPSNLIRRESVIVTGKVITDSSDQHRITGITDFRMGFLIESYIDKYTHQVLTHNSDTIGVEVPGINDILLYSCQNDTLKINPDFHPFTL